MEEKAVFSLPYSPFAIRYSLFAKNMPLHLAARRARVLQIHFALQK
jgi:hypothetical protein